MHAQDKQQGRTATPAAPVQRGASRGAGTFGTALPSAGSFTPAQLLALQRSAGNRAVSAMLAGQDAAPVQRSAVHEVLRGSGRPLETGVRTEMETRLGADFGDVRLHSDAVAQRSAAEIGARAYTSGSHIVLGPGGADRHTLAHELTHVIQQRRGPVAGTETGDGLRVSDPSDAFERAAEANATRALAEPLPGAPTEAAETAGGAGSAGAGGSVQRDCAAGPHSHHPRPGDAATVQRAVGFEFEAQWNVRRVADPAAAEATRAAQAEERERLLDAKLLDRMLNPYSPYRDLLTPEEQASREQCRALWFDGDRLTAAGEVRLKESKLGSGEGRAAAEMSLMIASELPEAPLAGENLGKGRGPDGVVVRGTKFDLTADASPSGGSNLEWVTDPLNSVAEVGTVLDGITHMARYLNSRQHDAFIASEDVTAGGGDPVPQLRIYPFGGALEFAPQTTAGMRLDRLPDLIGYLSGGDKDKPAGNPVRAAVNRVSEAFTHNGERRAQAKTDLYNKGLGKITEAKTGAEQAVRAFAAATPELTLTATGTGSLTGLVMHLAAYVLEGQALQAGANAKSIAGGLMARTDFAYNFGLLPAGVRTWFRENPDRFVDLVLAAAHAQGTGGQPLFGASVERGLANDRTQTTIGLTRQQWLHALPLGHDLLKNAAYLTDEEQGMVADEQGAEAVHKSLGALGDQDNRLTTKKGEELQLLVAELRRMEDNVPAERLKPLAVAAFKLIEQLNAGKELRYAKRK